MNKILKKRKKLYSFQEISSKYSEKIEEIFKDQKENKKKRTVGTDYGHLS